MTWPTIRNKTYRTSYVFDTSCNIYMFSYLNFFKMKLTTNQSRREQKKNVRCICVFPVSNTDELRPRIDSLSLIWGEMCAFSTRSGIRPTSTLKRSHRSETGRRI